jgi:hypothetical protein
MIIMLDAAHVLCGWGLATVVGPVILRSIQVADELIVASECRSEALVTEPTIASQTNRVSLYALFACNLFLTLSATFQLLQLHSLRLAGLLIKRLLPLACHKGQPVG